jgi:hypothetical protein
MRKCNNNNDDDNSVQFNSCLFTCKLNSPKANNNNFINTNRSYFWELRNVNNNNIMKYLS